VATTGVDQAIIWKDHVATSDDHQGASALPATAVSVQRVVTKGQSAGEGEAELAAVAESAMARVVHDTSLPVVSSRGGAGSASAEAAEQPQLGKPTLGVPLGQAPLTRQPSPMSERVSGPAEPAVQRVEFLAAQLAPARRGSESSRPQSQVASETPTSPPAPAAWMLPATASTAQRLPSQDGEHVSNSPARHLLAVSRGATQVEARQVEASEIAAPQVVHAASVQRLESLDPAASTQAVDPEFTEPQQTQANRSTWEVHLFAGDRPGLPPAADAPTVPAVGQLPAGQSVADVPTAGAVADLPTGRVVGGVPTAPAVSEVPLGPAVVPEPWTTSTGIGAGAQTHDHSLPTVSRLAADARATYQTSGSGGSNPRIAVGPPLTVQRVAALGAQSSGQVSSPLVASRELAPSWAPNESGNGGEMSFASIFGAADGGESASTAEEGFTTVQLLSADESSASSLEPASDTSSAPPAVPAPPPPPAGTPSADLDEMARRLYEPLSARLKAELWLDRERAGVMSDG
jgi:hypothetical protein